MFVTSLVDVLGAIRNDFQSFVKNVGEMLQSKIKIMALIDEIMIDWEIHIEERPKVLPISADIPAPLREFALKMLHLVDDQTTLKNLGKSEILDPIHTLCEIVDQAMQKRKSKSLPVDDLILVKEIDVFMHFRVVLIRFFRFVLCAACLNRDVWLRHLEAIEFPTHLFARKTATSGLPLSSSLRDLGATLPVVKSEVAASTPALSPPRDSLPFPRSSRGGSFTPLEKECKGIKPLFLDDTDKVDEKATDEHRPLKEVQRKSFTVVRKLYSSRTGDESSRGSTSPISSRFPAKVQASFLPELKVASSFSLTPSSSRTQVSCPNSDCSKEPGVFVSLVFNVANSLGSNAQFVFSKTNRIREKFHHHHSVHRHSSSVEASNTTSITPSHVRQRSISGVQHNAAISSTPPPAFSRKKAQSMNDIQRLRQAVMECKSRIETITQSVRRCVECLKDADEFLEYVYEAQANSPLTSGSLDCPPSCAFSTESSSLFSSIDHSLSSPSLLLFDRFSRCSPTKYTPGSPSTVRSYRHSLSALGTILDLFMGNCAVQREEEEEREKRNAFISAIQSHMDASQRMKEKNITSKSFSHHMHPTPCPPLFPAEQDEEILPKFAAISMVSSFTALLSAHCHGNSDLLFGDSFATGGLQSPPLSYCSVVDFSNSAHTISAMDSTGLCVGGLGDSFLAGGEHTASNGKKSVEDYFTAGIRELASTQYGYGNSIASNAWPTTCGGSGRTGESSGIVDLNSMPKVLISFDNEKCSRKNDIMTFPSATQLPSNQHTVAKTQSKAHHHSIARLRAQERSTQPSTSLFSSSINGVSCTASKTRLPSVSKIDNQHAFGVHPFNRTLSNAPHLHSHSQVPHTYSEEDIQLTVAAVVLKLEMVANNLAAEFASCFVQVAPEILEMCPIVLRADGREYRKIKLRRHGKTVSLPRIPKRR